MIKKIIKILILIILLISIITLTYAAYKNMLKESTKSNIQPWVIFINDENIASTEEKTFNIKEVIKSNNNIAEGKIAPGAIIELPIEINATKTKNMDIRYDIIIEQLEETQPNFKIMNVVEENFTSEITKTGENTYTGIITRAEIDRQIPHKLIVSVIWEYDDIYNDLDTAIGTKEERQLINIKLKVNVSQYGNEEIVEYN